MRVGMVTMMNCVLSGSWKSARAASIRPCPTNGRLPQLTTGHHMPRFATSSAIEWKAETFEICCVFDTSHTWQAELISPHLNNTE
jgi:hypothetical protein